MWGTPWRRTLEPSVQLPHPSHPRELHTFRIYDIDGPNGLITFAAAELSMNVWGFYVRK